MTKNEHIRVYRLYSYFKEPDLLKRCETEAKLVVLSWVALYLCEYSAEIGGKLN